MSRLAILCAIAACSAAGQAGTPAAETRPALLGTASFWRCHLTRGGEGVRLASGETIGVHDLAFSERVKVDGKSVDRLRRHGKVRAWPLPSAGWRETDFDDGAWALLPGPFGTGPYKSDSYWYRSIPLICLRGRFQLDDPAAAGPVTLTLGVHGGAVVYLNGKELARVGLPEGKIGPLTPAAAYPADAFLTPDGELLSMRGPRDAEKYPKRFALRVRWVKDLRVAPDRLRKGVNVLAVEIHRAPAPEVMFTGQAKGIARWDLKQRYAWWPRAGLFHAALAAKAAAPAARPLHAWTCPVTQKLTVEHDAGPAAPPTALRIVGVRNGSFSGQIVASADRPLKGLRAAASALTGPAGAAIPASAVQLRYALPDGRAKRAAPYFNGLARHAPAEVAAGPGGATQPIWVTVRVPAGAAAGEYAGTVTVGAAGEADVRAAVRLRVIDWTAPDAKDFFTFVGMFQSPESVAMQYETAMWSAEHWARLDRSFEQMGRLGVKTIYVTAIRQTHLGNAHGMIRHVRGAGGALRPDFTIAEKYLDLAVKHLGKVPVVGLYCWETFDSGGRFHFGHYARKDPPVRITVRDPATGKLSEAEAPQWGTDACRAFWKPVFDGMRAILDKRGMGASLMAGVCGDFEPTAAALANVKAASGGVRWISHSHTVRHGVGPERSHPTGYIAAAWGGHARLDDPALAGRAYGWKNDFHRVTTREFPAVPLAQRLYLERLVCSRIAPRRRGVDTPEFGLHGMGRMGADFWPVLGGRSSWKGSILARYPEARWGQLNVALWMPALLAPGRDGAVATVAAEMFRENIQEIEARIFIEKALTDEARRARLGDNLARRCQRVLDDRIRMILRIQNDRSLMGPAWQIQSEALYEAAAEVARAVGKT